MDVVGIVLTVALLAALVILAIALVTLANTVRGQNEAVSKLLSDANKQLLSFHNAALTYYEHESELRRQEAEAEASRRARADREAAVVEPPPPIDQAIPNSAMDLAGQG